MRQLPQSVQTLDGLSVQPRGPEVLQGLLSDYEAALHGAGFPVHGALRPGISEGTVRDQFGRVGLEPGPELLVWYGWRDGFTGDMRLPSPHMGPGIDVFLPLEESIDRYMHDRQKDYLAWPAEWVRLISTQHGIIARCVPEDPQLLMAARIDALPGEEGAPPTIVSLCTPITWWVEAIRNGNYQFDRSSGRWDSDYRDLPLERRHSGMV